MLAYVIFAHVINLMMIGCRQRSQIRLYLLHDCTCTETACQSARLSRQLRPIHSPLHLPMSAVAILRLATRTHPSSTLLRPHRCCSAAPRRLSPAVSFGGYGGAHTFSTTVRRNSGEHGEESFEEFSARYDQYSRGALDSAGCRVEEATRRAQRIRHLLERINWLTASR